MKRSSGARIGATLAVSALSLALITGCSDKGSDDSKETGSDSSSGSTAKTYTVAELQKLILAQGEVDGYKVSKTVGAPETKDEVTTSDEKCRPLAFAMSAQAPGDAKSETTVTVTQEKTAPTDSASKSLEDLAEGEFEDSLTDAMSVNVTLVGLSSYEGDAAQETFNSVSDAVEGCSGGYTVTADGEKQNITKVTAEKGSGTGDESVAFASETEMDEETKGTVHAEVVRHGNTIATYYTLNLGALMTEKAYTIDGTVVTAQAKKIK